VRTEKCDVKQRAAASPREQEKSRVFKRRPRFNAEGRFSCCVLKLKEDVAGTVYKKAIKSLACHESSAAPHS